MRFMLSENRLQTSSGDDREKFNFLVIYAANFLNMKR